MNKATAHSFPTPPQHNQTDIFTLEDQITELAAHIHAATYRLLELIREYDERNGWEGPGMRSCAHWLNWKCGINLGAAREKVRVAHALDKLPNTSTAFRDGRLSYSKVRAMTRVATPENEDYLLNIAKHGTAAHVERLVRQFRRVKRLEALEHENERHALRELSWYVDEDGSLIMKGQFTPEQGAVIKAALEKIMEEDFQEQKDVSAETSDDECRPRSEPIAARRADALTRMSQAYMSGTTPQGGCSGDRFLVHVHTDMETLRADGTGAEAEIEHSGNVSAETSRRLSCNAGVVRWMEDKQGNTMDIGRKSRTIPPSIRRALQRRDAGCRFPGCTCSRFVDAHHIQHWADGGDTCMDNLVLLCRHHHRLVHEGGFGVRISNNAINFIDPHGKTISTGPERRFRGNVFALTAQNKRTGIRITSKTTIPRWHGEQMDDQMAIDGLLQREV